MKIIENGHIEEVAVGGRSRWIVLNNLWAGCVLYVALKVGLSHRGLQIGNDLEFLIVVPIGAFASSKMLAAIGCSRLRRGWKLAWYWILALSYLPLSVLLAMAVGKSFR